MHKSLDMRYTILLCFSLLFIQCKTLKKTTNNIVPETSLDIQGHRGCRGLLPENTIPAFKHALDLGVHTLELDVVVTKDKVVVVSHEPFLNHEICRTADGTNIEESKEKEYNIYEMTFAELLQHDCGLNRHSKFPEQKNIPTTKPSLNEMIKASEQHAKHINRAAPLYNIEIKRTKEGDNIYHPDYKEFTDLTIDVIKSNGIQDRATVQCFDIEVLQYMHKQYPEQAQVFLVANEKSTAENIQELGHIPEIFSPYWKMINADMLSYCKDNGMKLIPWTVNEIEDIKTVMGMGVDGIITDYPDRLINLVRK